MGDGDSVRRLTIGALALALACSLAVFLASEIGWLAGLDARAYDLAIRSRLPAKSSHRVAVVEIDDESIALMGRWPWNRSVHAKFLKALREHYRPAAVAFDLLLAEPEGRDQDEAFAREIKAAGNVYLASFFTPFAGAKPGAHGDPTPWAKAGYVGDSRWAGKRFPGLQPPTPDLAAAAAGVGHVNVFPERDGSIRRLPLVIDYDGVPYLSLIAAVLNATVNPERTPVSARLGSSIQFGSTRLPIDASGEMLISYGRDPESENGAPFRHYPYHSVLTRGVPRVALEDKIVIVGFGATGMADIHPTPISAGSLGVEVNAYALSGLLDGQRLAVAGWPLRLALVLLWGAFASFAAARWPAAGALAAVIALPVLAWVVAWIALSSVGLWPGAAPPGAAAVASSVMASALRFRRSERESLRMGAGVDALALATRLIGSARQRQDLINEIRSQANETVGALQTNIYLLNQAGDRLVLSLPQLTDRAPLSYALGEGTVGWVARYPAGHLVNQPDPASTVGAELARSVSFPVGSVAYAPMAHRGKVVGVIEAIRTPAQPPFERAHLPMLEALAAEAAVALENLSLYEKLEGRVEIANRQLLGAFQELKEERDRITAILSNMADGVVLTDARQRLVFLNSAAEAMFGLQSGDIGRPVADALPFPELLRQLDRHAPPPAGIPRIKLTQPRRMTLSPRTVLLTQPDGTTAGAVTVLSDITLLEELSEMKTEFVSVVSHELRTPLTSIMGFSQTLQGSAATITDRERDEFLSIIEQESHRLLVMINDLLDVSRMEAGRPLTINYQHVDLRQLAQHVVRFQSVTTTSHQFRFDFPEAGLSVSADPDRAQQMLTNLVSNAIKYSPKGGEIVVGGHEDGDQRVIYVRDQGVGIAPEQLGNLFERYQRIDREAIKGIRGTGLGLFLVRALAEAHHGKVWVESEVGKGSTFYISLPATAPPS
ncbi:MAG: CHASE2 domain-containing protein [Armatimonadota bacterium]